MHEVTQQELSYNRNYRDAKRFRQRQTNNGRL